MVTPKAGKHLQPEKTRVSWLVLAVTIVTVLIFARLGFWQLSRAQEKLAMLEAANQAATLAPLTAIAGISESDLYRGVTLTGQFDFDRQFLRDNIVYEKQAGYEVLTPFVIDATADSATQTLLINRGWLPAGADRRQRPDVYPSTVSDLDRIEGVLVQPSRGFTLGEAIDQSEQQWPLMLQFLDYEMISARLDDVNLLPAVVVLASDHPLSYTYTWKPVADGPEKHYGYAFQWFAMLVAVVCLFIYLNFFKKDEQDSA